MTERHSGRHSSPGDDSHSERRGPRFLDLLPIHLHGAFNSMCDRREAPAGKVLLGNGNNPDRNGYLVSGMLRVTRILPDGNEPVLGLLAPNDMYGRLCEVRDGYEIAAVSAVVVMTFGCAEFDDLLAQATESDRLFVASLLDEFDAAREWAWILSGRKIEQRVGAFLLSLCRRKLRRTVLASGHGPAGSISLHLPIQRADLAHYLDAAAPELSRVFYDLEKAGCIRINHPFDFDVVDLPALTDIAGHDLPGGRAVILA